MKIEEPMLQLVVVSATTQLEQRLLSAAAISHLSVSCTTCESATQFLAIGADCVIFDGVPPEDGLFGHAQCELWVLCADSEALAALNNPLLEDCLTAVWTKPLTDKVLGLHLTQLAKHCKAVRERNVGRMYLDTLIDSVPDLIWFKDLKGAHLKVNEAFCRAVGKTKDQCCNRGHYYIWDIEPDEYANGEYVCLETEEEVIRKGATCLFDEKVMIKNSLHQFKTYKSPLYDKNRHMVGTVGIAKDVTDMQNISRELSLVLDSLPLATLIAGANDEIVYANDEFYEYFAIAPQQLKAMQYSQMCQTLLQQQPQNLSHVTMQEIMPGRGGKDRVLRVQQQPINDIFGNHFGYFFLALDVTKENELQQKIKQNANTDVLTGLYNRRHFYEIAADMGNKGPVSVVYMDLDNFKQVNDTYGHKIGDEVLVAVAALMQDNFQDDLITRLGGDEFLVVDFKNDKVEAVQRKIDQLMEAVAALSRKEPMYHGLSLCAGLVYSAKGVPDMDTLVQQADKALYEAKSAGKARCVTRQF